MDTDEFDRALIGAVFAEAGLVGWHAAGLVSAASDAGLDLARVRARFPSKTAVLLRFGTVADQAVLAEVPTGGTPREKLFDLVMLRFDQLQAHRLGILSVIQAMHTNPGTGLLLMLATLRSMRWLLDAAGVPVQGLTGTFRVKGMLAVWAYCLRAWEKDESADLSATMAALDRALDRAMQAEDTFPGRRSPPEVPTVSGTDVAAAPDGPAVL